MPFLLEIPILVGVGTDAALNSVTGLLNNGEIGFSTDTHQLEVYYAGTVYKFSTGGGGGTPGGADTLVQFNDGGTTFGGDAGLVVPGDRVTHQQDTGWSGLSRVSTRRCGQQTNGQHYRDD